MERPEVQPDVARRVWRPGVEALSTPARGPLRRRLATGGPAPANGVVGLVFSVLRGLRRRLTDMGLNEGMRLKVLHFHRPGPCIILVGNTRLVLGYGMAHKILVQEV